MILYDGTAEVLVSNGEELCICEKTPVSWKPRGKGGGGNNPITQGIIQLNFPVVTSLKPGDNRTKHDFFC